MTPTQLARLPTGAGRENDLSGDQGPGDDQTVTFPAGKVVPVSLMDV